MEKEEGQKEERLDGQTKRTLGRKGKKGTKIQENGTQRTECEGTNK